VNADTGCPFTWVRMGTILSWISRGQASGFCDRRGESKNSRRQLYSACGRGRTNPAFRSVVYRRYMPDSSTCLADEVHVLKGRTARATRSAAAGVRNTPCVTGTLLGATDECSTFSSNASARMAQEGEYGEPGAMVTEPTGCSKDHRN